jgi:4'-phosphopantetheinyl transferase
MNGLATKQIWQTAPENLGLENDQIHVWLVNFAEATAADFEPIISADERVRANRFRFAKDRNNFIIGRGFLRKIIGNYLQINPSQIEFEYNQFGKPFLSSNLKFNLSHSGNLALLAVGLDFEIGVDIEQKNGAFIDDGMILHCLTANEKSHFYSLPKNEKITFFFDCWTTKEAYLKAYSFGLSVEPNQIETAELLQSDFAFPRLPVIDGYSSALTIQSQTSQIDFYYAKLR